MDLIYWKADNSTWLESGPFPQLQELTLEWTNLQVSIIKGSTCLFQISVAQIIVQGAPQRQNPLFCCSPRNGEMFMGYETTRSRCKHSSSARPAFLNPLSLFLTKPSLGNWLSLGMWLSNLNVNLEGTFFLTGGVTYLLEDMKIRVVMRWQRSSTLSQHNTC